MVSWSTCCFNIWPSTSISPDLSEHCHQLQFSFVHSGHAPIPSALPPQRYNSTITSFIGWLWYWYCMVAFRQLSITPSTSKTFVHTSVSVGVLGHATHPSKNGCDAKDHFRQRILMIYTTRPWFSLVVSSLVLIALMPYDTIPRGRVIWRWRRRERESYIHYNNNNEDSHGLRLEWRYGTYITINNEWN